MSDLPYPLSRPQSIAEVLDAAFRIFQRTLVRSLPLGALTILVGQSANIYSLLRGRPVGVFGAKDGAWWAMLVVSEVLVALVWYAMIARQYALVSAQPSTIAGELGKAARRFPQILLLFVMQIGSLIAAIVALVIPALYLVVSFAQSWPAFAIDQLSAVEAYKAGVRLTFGNWWRVATAGSVALVVVFVFYLVGALVIGVVLQFSRPGDVEVIYAASTMMTLALGALLAPFYSALLIAIHFDLRAREARAKEVAAG